MQFDGVAGPAAAFHDREEDRDLDLPREMAHAGIEIGLAAEKADADARQAGTQIGHDGEELAFAQVGKDLAQRGAGPPGEQFDAGGVAQALEVILHQGVFLHAGEGEHVDAAGRDDDARQFPVAHVGAGEDAAAAGMLPRIRPDAVQRLLHVDRDGQVARPCAADVEHFREVEGHVAEGLPSDGPGLAGRTGVAQHEPDAPDGLFAPRGRQREADAGENGGQTEGRPAGQGGDEAADAPQQQILGPMFRAVLHGWPSDDAWRAGTRRARMESVQACGTNRATSSASGAARVTP